MTFSQTPPVPWVKYNVEWRQRQPLVCSDDARRERAAALARSKDLTSSEAAAVYLHELVGSDGLEFVAFTNAHLHEPAELPGAIILVPCFVTDLPSALDLEDPVVQATFRMHQRARFVYDGWLPISDWTTSAVRKRIRQLEEALSTLALVGSVWYSWQPKYSPEAAGESCYYLGGQNMEAIQLVTSFAESVSQADSEAMFRSLGWLSQSLRLSEPAARFLFCVLAIESLATYIENEAGDDSAFAHLASSRLTKGERKTEREECIRDTLNRLLESDPTQAIESAYFHCVISIRRRLQTHLERVFAPDSEPVDLLFGTEGEGASLWDLRHLVAHGSADALSHKQRDAISARIYDAERTARSYIGRVLELTMEHGLVTSQLRAGIMLLARNGVATSDEIYAGPTHMALVYT